MKKYTTYKPSGIEWIGDIPEHWEVSKVKYLTEIFGRIGYRGYTTEDIVSEGDGVITISPSNIKDDIFTLETSLTYLSYEKYYQSPEIMIFPNDILLVKTGSTIGKTSIVPTDVPEMTINPQLIVLKNIKINHKFLYYQTTCDYFKISFFVEQTGSSTPTISQEKVNNFPLLIPKSNEQQQIVQFLDEKTEIIDKLISTKERKIDLLKEQRTSLINQVITKGLDSNVKMKDSGVEWIGEIPEHWVVSKLNYQCNRVGDGLHSTPIYSEDTDYYFINGNNLKEGKVVITDNTRKVDYQEYLNHFIELTKEETLLLSINGTIGNVSYYNDEKVILGKSVCYINLRPNNLNLDFIYFLLGSQSVQNYFTFELTGTTIYNLSLNSIRNTPIPLPPISEQKLIVEYLDKRTKEIDDLMSLEQKKIEVLKEYRQSLISEVITGKINVCNN